MHEKGKLTDANFKNILATYTKDKSNIIKLIQKEGISFFIISEAIKENFNIDPISLYDLIIDEEATNLLNYEFAEKNCIFPFALSEDTISVAVSNPFNNKLTDDIKIITGLSATIFFCEQDEIKYFISSYYEAKKLNSLNSLFNKKEHSEVIAYSNQEIKSAPTVRLVDSIIQSALSKEASDIHIEPYDQTLKIRFRIDGKLKDFKDFDNSLKETIISRLKIMSQLDIGEKRFPQEGHFILKQNNLDIDFRVSTVPTVYGEKAVIRIFFVRGRTYELNQLGFFEEDVSLIRKLSAKPYGAILLTGPTGSGKSTTLYSLLNLINIREQNIVTIEDPVENHIFGITQIEIGKKTGLDFVNVLEHVLRQDPDVLMIGEIRNEKTAIMAMQASITGHLVLSTLHTNDSLSAIIRLLNMGVKNYLIAGGLSAVIAQRLVRRLCNYCKREIQTDDHVSNLLNVEKGTLIFEKVGCKRCNHSGYKGRIAVYEILVIDDYLKSAIEKGESSENLKQYLNEKNFVYIKQNIIKNVILGNISYQEMIAFDLLSTP